jgi:ABC-type lipopolysaccharide export system ATPase subunit
MVKPSLTDHGNSRRFMNIIEEEHLSKRFGDAQAVDDASFSVREGDLSGFAGPNSTHQIPYALCLSLLNAFSATLFTDILWNINRIMDRAPF